MVVLPGRPLSGILADLQEFYSSVACHHYSAHQQSSNLLVFSLLYLYMIEGIV